MLAFIYVLSRLAEIKSSHVRLSILYIWKVGVYVFFFAGTVRSGNAGNKNTSGWMVLCIFFLDGKNMYTIK